MAAASSLRFVMCGSVDDGKSTLIGRLLHDAGALYDDQVRALAADSRKYGTQREALDFALLMDGLMAEREQSITIDVAYRYFSTARRAYVVADAPGHEQYTRNMVTAASTADAAVLLIDVQKGLLAQTRRHAFILALMGVRHIVVAVNKMDLMSYSAAAFGPLEDACREFARQLGDVTLTVIPVSALQGENVVARSSRMDWYRGASLLETLESLRVDNEGAQALPLRLPVQWVNRPDQNFRGFAGTIAGGSVQPGDEVRVLPAGRSTRVARIVALGGDLPQAFAGQAVTLTLTDEIDVSRGDVIAAAAEPPKVADQFEATLIWLAEEPMLGGRTYLMKIGAATPVATPAAPKYRIDVKTLEHVAASKLQSNEIGVCNLSLDRPVAFESYRANRDLGGFVLIDRISNQTVAAGLLHFALRRADNVPLQALDIGKKARATALRQTPCIIWLTGLPAAGNSTIANLLELELFRRGRHTYLLDGDNVRHGLNRDLGFTDADRVENVRRVGEVARLMMDAGLIVIVSMISPYRSERRAARHLVEEDEFIEVYVDTPPAIAESRDPKGHYKKARRGDLKNFTGIDSAYEPPEHPEIHLETAEISAEQATQQIMRYLADHKLID